MQVVGRDDDIEAVIAERRRRHALEIQGDGAEREPFARRPYVQRRHDRGVTIDPGRGEALAGEPQRVAAAAARHVEREAAAGQQRAVGHEPGGRCFARNVVVHQSAVSARAIACPATQPDDHAHWKLKPPSRPSTSRISPTR